jgi:reactive intermediate/imine deaminase
MTDVRRRELRVPELGEPISHYTDAVAFGDLLFVSGCIGLDHVTGHIDPDVAEQTRQVFRNMTLILEAAGASVADVLKVTVFLTDITDRERINPVRQEFFGEHRPASTLIEISKLARTGAKVEIEAVVGLPS